MALIELRRVGEETGENSLVYQALHFLLTKVTLPLFGNFIIPYSRALSLFYPPSSLRHLEIRLLSLSALSGALKFVLMLPSTFKLASLGET